VAAIVGDFLQEFLRAHDRRLACGFTPVVSLRPTFFATALH
jgi:hypothetical protein